VNAFGVRSNVDIDVTTAALGRLAAMAGTLLFVAFAHVVALSCTIICGAGIDTVLRLRIAAMGHRRAELSRSAVRFFLLGAGVRRQWPVMAIDGAPRRARIDLGDHAHDVENTLTSLALGSRAVDKFVPQ